jgi:hypothetical protein
MSFSCSKGLVVQPSSKQHFRDAPCSGFGMAFDEDRGRKDNGPENLSILLKLALNLLRKARLKPPSPQNANALDGPTTSQKLSSAKCNSPDQPCKMSRRNHSSTSCLISGKRTSPKASNCGRIYCLINCPYTRYAAAKRGATDCRRAGIMFCLGLGRTHHISNNVCCRDT